jgi:Rieske [2Fe-2S] domain
MHNKLPETLKIGVKYWVPCLKIRDDWNQEDNWMPVFATGHIDEENLFREMNRITAGQTTENLPESITELYDAQGEECAEIEHFHVDIRFTRHIYSHGAALPGKTSVVWKKKECTRLLEDYYIDDPVPLIYQASCEESRMTNRLICPHQQISLRGVPVNDNGEVVCPAHGLKWCTKTGLLVPRPEKIFQIYAIAYQNGFYQNLVAAREALEIRQPAFLETVWANMPEYIRLYYDQLTFEADCIKFE